MPRLRFRGLDACLLLQAAFCSDVLASSDWFAPPCDRPALVQTSPDFQEMLVSVRRAPDDSGDNDRMLRSPDGRLWVLSDRLERWRVPLPKERVEMEGEVWRPLNAIPGLRHRYDDCSQTLWIDTAAATRTVARFDLQAEARLPVSLARVESGAYLNLDAQLLRTAGTWQWASLADAGFLSPYGYGSNSLIVTQDDVVRLETYWNIDDPELLQRLRLGDVITRGSAFGLSARMGGVQWGRQFSLRPDLITYPLPSFRGQAALASSVDVYVNQSLRSSQSVPTGPFELNRIPVVAGQGEVQLVVRDVLGREQVIAYPFYAAPSLLREGLSDYTVEAGWLRDHYGSLSADYGRFMTGVTYRRGLSDVLTGEFHAEMLHEQQLLAVSGAWLHPALGVFSAGVSGSGTAQRGVGGSVQLGFERVGSAWSLAAELRRASPDFTRAADGPDPLRSSELARLGFVPHPSGSLSLSYLHQRRETSGEVAVAALSYSYGFAPGWNLFATLTHAESQGRDDTVYVGVSWLFARDYFGIVEYMGDRQMDRGRVTVQRNPRAALDYTWRASTETGENGRTEWHGQWMHARGNMSATAEHYGNSTNYRVGYATGLALQRDSLFWTRPVEGSFAVVEASGVPGARIYADEQVTGRTDEDGLLLIPNVRTYESTQIRIDDSDVPIEYEISTLQLPLFLPTRGAARVRFDLRTSAAVPVRLRQRDGQPVPAGAEVRVTGMPASLPVGFDGQAYLQRPAGVRFDIEAAWGDHRCRAHVEAAADTPEELLCNEVQP